MGQASNLASTIAQDAPIAGFSHCHVDIVNHLEMLGGLPALLAPARRAREIATNMLVFFDTVIVQHHAEEEQELFSAVLRSAMKGREQARVEEAIERLTTQHRQIEAWWSRIKPQLKQISKGHDADLDPAAVAQLIRGYRAHAAAEEAEFLPLAQTILGRNSNHMEALGLSLHMRHVKLLVSYL
jgi:hemerythrin-like domain-containing protein